VRQQGHRMAAGRLGKLQCQAIRRVSCRALAGGREVPSRWIRPCKISRRTCGVLTAAVVDVV
jgi:hypothetical protein